MENNLNKTFGQLKLLEYKGKDKSRNHLYLCECICGTKKTIAFHNLKSGAIISCGCKRKHTSGSNCFNNLYALYEIGATKRNLSFELTKEQFKQLTQEDCHYCGVKPKSERKSIRAKNSMSYEDFIEYINRIKYGKKN